MDTLCFELSGKTAFFKQPDVNSYFYFTYGNIHKVALLGMIGAILGYGGYAQQKRSNEKEKPVQDDFPEFYERLHTLKVSIAPRAEKGVFRKKIQVFNNSVGYASLEQGGNLIVKEQWLENPLWDISILLDCEEAIKVADWISGSKCIFIPYLGTNDHYADIKNVHVEEAVPVKSSQGKIENLCLKKNISFQENVLEIGDISYKYEENLPYMLDLWTNNYKLERFIYTDGSLEWENQDVYEVDGKNLMFY